MNLCLYIDYYPSIRQIEILSLLFQIDRKLERYIERQKVDKDIDSYKNLCWVSHIHN